MAPSVTEKAYSRADVRRILNIQENRLRCWERLGLLEPKQTFEFRDLLVLTTLNNLRRKRVPNKRISDSIAALEKRLSGRRSVIKEPLRELRFDVERRRVAVDLPGGRIDPLSGQWLIDFERPASKTVVALARSQSRPGGEARQEAEEWFRQALRLEETGAPAEDALRCYRKALELNPRAAGAWVNIGTLLYRERELDEAEQSYRNAVAISPDYALAHFNLGNICEELGRLREAVEHYQKALEINPAYADAHYNLALVLERLGEPMRAVRHWKAYLNYDSDSPWAGIARQQLRSLLPVLRGGREQPRDRAVSPQLRPAGVR